MHSYDPYGLIRLNRRQRHRRQALIFAAACVAALAALTVGVDVVFGWMGR